MIDVGLAIQAQTDGDAVLVLRDVILEEHWAPLDARRLAHPHRVKRRGHYVPREDIHLTRRQWFLAVSTTQERWPLATLTVLLFKDYGRDIWAAARRAWSPRRPIATQSVTDMLKRIYPMSSGPTLWGLDRGLDPTRLAGQQLAEVWNSDATHMVRAVAAPDSDVGTIILPPSATRGRDRGDR